ncbi:MAG: heavy metal translocating P-type ATPase, partial [Treponema sp.]|nr:heavy metal translocating P-type ATPase [Treponema sp.]
MQVTVHHSLPGRLRLHYNSKNYSSRQAVLAQGLIAVQDGIKDINVNPNSGSFLIFYNPVIITEKQILSLFKALSSKYLDDEEMLNAVADVPVQESIMGVLVETLAIHFIKKLLPLPVRTVFLWKNILPRIGLALGQIIRGKIFSTELLDATALTVAACSGNRNTASSISMLLKMGEEIEDITRRQSYNNLAQTLLISTEPVHIVSGKTEKTVPANTLKKGDLLVVRQGDLIPADGTVEHGEGMVNQASITGEALPVDKKADSTVFAGTLLEEGELYIRVISTGKDTKVQNIIQMIDNSQNLKAQAQKRSENFAERIVPFNFLFTGLTYLFTRNITKTISTLMVDYSCAMKLTAPIAVLSAMKEAASSGISVKGGKYLEEAALADTIVFDKTGTLTYANPLLASIFPMQGYSEDDVLKWAACLEEHYPHPLGRAVVKAAEERNLVHPEEHTKVDYIVAHGIASTYNGKKIRIGSAHFIFEDEAIPMDEKIALIQKEAADTGNSLLYLAYDQSLAGIIAIGDPARPGTKEIIERLHQLGIKNCIMITGDTEGAAKKIAKECGLDKWYSQALPEDKVKLVEKLKKKGSRVMMMGDGINDAPALSAADVGIAVDGCSSIAGDTSDIQFSRNGLDS